MSAALNWRTVTHSQSPKFMVKGTELSNTLAGDRSRYQICEHRSYDSEGFADRQYYVRDAESVSDADVKAGKRPAIVGRFDDLDAAINFVSGT